MYSRHCHGETVDGGIPGARARALAVSMLAMLEGAFLLSCSLRDTELMDAAGEAAVGLVTEAWGDST
ncbi:MAG: hypothetical protein WBQ21_05615 [Solirubrobacteraceae bacterium]